MARVKFISDKKIEYYFFDNFYINIMSADVNFEAEVIVQTYQTPKSLSKINMLKNNSKVEELSHEEFLEVLNYAYLIINNRTREIN